MAARRQAGGVAAMVVPAERRRRAAEILNCILADSSDYAVFKGLAANALVFEGFGYRRRFRNDTGNKECKGSEQDRKE